MSDRIVVGTTRELIRDVAAAWRGQYGDEPSDSRFAEILARLDSLDVETATTEDVEAIIGNASWTRQSCDVCRRDVEAWVRLGDEPDYDSATLDVCADCLAAASAILARRESALPGSPGVVQKGERT